jgi:2-oxoglutarate ferredoxin oxidoreductase subunit delta
MVIIDELYCKGCYLCSHYCPKKIIKPSGKRNGKGYIIPCMAEPEACTKCKTCELICPELALTVEEGAN